MDGAGFDAWTRRRCGTAAGGLLALLIGLREPMASEAKKRKKRRARPAVERPVAVPIRQTPAPAPAPAPAPQPSSSGVDDGSAEFLPEGRG